MMPNDIDGEGWIICIEPLHFVNLFVKDITRDLSSYAIIVISREIIGGRNTDGRFMGKRNDINDAIQYESKYDNVEFVTDFIPDKSVWQHSAASGDKHSTQVIYENQLNTKESMISMCSIVDMVVNDHVKVIMLVSGADNKAGHIETLLYNFEDKFNIHIFQTEEIIDPEIDCNNYGDLEKIKASIIRYKEMLSETNRAEDFFNKFTDSLEEKYTKILAENSMSDLKKYAISKGVYPEMARTKEELIDLIISAMV